MFILQKIHVMFENINLNANLCDLRCWFLVERIKLKWDGNFRMKSFEMRFKLSWSYGSYGPVANVAENWCTRVLRFVVGDGIRTNFKVQRAIWRWAQSLVRWKLPKCFFTTATECDPIKIIIILCSIESDFSIVIFRYVVFHLIKVKPLL